MQSVFLSLSLLLAVFCGSCATPTEPAGAFSLTTDDTTYVYDSVVGPRIDLTVRNVSASVVSLAACNGVVFPAPEAEFGDQWKAFTLVSCEPYDALDLAPGETIVVWGRVPGVGTFRLRVPLYVSRWEQRLDPSSSNVFTVR